MALATTWLRRSPAVRLEGALGKAPSVSPSVSLSPFPRAALARETSRGGGGDSIAVGEREGDAAAGQNVRDFRGQRTTTRAHPKARLGARSVEDHGAPEALRPPSVEGRGAPEALRAAGRPKR